MSESARLPLVMVVGTLERRPPAAIVLEARRCDLAAAYFEGEAARARSLGREARARGCEAGARARRSEALRLLGVDA